MQAIRQQNLLFSTTEGKDSRKEKFFFIRYIDLRRRGNSFSKHYICVSEDTGKQHTVNLPTDELTDLYCMDRLGQYIGVDLTWDSNDKTKKLVQSIFYDHRSNDGCINISYMSEDRRSTKNIRISMNELGQILFFNFDCIEYTFRKYFINLD